jgi:general secretion pathway protein J
VKQVSRGFTLVELLVVLTLIGLIFVGLFSGLHLIGRATDASDRTSAALSDVETAQTFLRRTISEAMAYLTVSAAKAPPGFAGGTQSLRFIGMLPEALRSGGPQLIEVAASPRGDGSLDLDLSWFPPRSDRAPIRRRLLGGAHAITFAYFGALPGVSGAKGWQQSWSGKAGPPMLVRIVVRFSPDDPRVWPDLVIAIPTALDAQSATNN